jgi:hypothetical protein
MTTQDALSAALQPPHGLILPGPVWGLDPSTLRLSACVLAPLRLDPPVAVRWQTQSYSRAGAEQTQLARGLGDLLRFFTGCATRTARPHAIYLEQPFAGSDKPNPTHRQGAPAARGLVLLRGASAVRARPPVRRARGADDRRRRRGKRKRWGPATASPTRHEIFRWAQSVGYTGSLQDEADAIGIATAGAVILQTPS